MALLRFPEFDPFRGLLELQEELERVFDRPFGFDLGLSGRGGFPMMNVFTDREGAVLRLEAPGVAPEDLKIECHGRTLTVSGKRDWKAPSEGAFHRRERDMGEFSRSIQLPEEYDLERAEASYKHGMLTVRVPKKAEAKPRQITVQAA
jgi:HSP20 family protein